MAVRELFSTNNYTLNCLNLNVANDLSIENLSTNNLTVTGTNDSTDALSGALRVSGGAGILNDLWIGGNIILPALETFSNAVQLNQPLHLQNGSEVTQISVGNTGTLYIDAGNGNSINLNNQTSITDNVQSSGPSTGSLVCAGGLGVGMDIWNNGNIHCPGYINVGVVNTNLVVCNTTISSSECDTGSLVLNYGTPLTYYNESSLFSYPLGGAVASVNLTGSYTKLNNQVTVNFNTIQDAANASDRIYTGTGSIPSIYRPANNIYAPCIVLNNSQITLGTVSISTAGLIIFYNGSQNNFSGSGNCGIYACSVVYLA